MNILETLVKLRDDLRAWTLNQIATVWMDLNSKIENIKNNTMTKTNPSGSGEFNLNGNANISGDINANTANFSEVYADYISSAEGELVSESTLSSIIELLRCDSLLPSAFTFNANINSNTFYPLWKIEGMLVGYAKVSDNYKELMPGMIQIEAFGSALPELEMVYRYSTSSGFMLAPQADSSEDIGIPFIIGLHGNNSDFPLEGVGLYALCAFEYSYEDDITCQLYPAIFVSRFYEERLANSPDVSWNNISIPKNNNVLTVDGNKLLWDGNNYLETEADGKDLNGGIAGYRVSELINEISFLIHNADQVNIGLDDGTIHQAYLDKSSYSDTGNVTLSFEDASTDSIVHCQMVTYQFGQNGYLLPGIYFGSKVRSIEFVGLSNIEEIYLHQIPEKLIPSTIKLPSYTAEDEGKVLQIVNGVPTWTYMINLYTHEEDLNENE